VHRLRNLSRSCVCASRETLKDIDSRGFLKQVSKLSPDNNLNVAGVQLVLAGSSESWPAKIRTAWLSTSDSMLIVAQLVS
jgi:hypothetical protein